MNAEEIRKAYGGQSMHTAYEPNDPKSVEAAKIEVMAEIAAQLAELNATLKKVTDGDRLCVDTRPE